MALRTMPYMRPLWTPQYTRKITEATDSSRCRFRACEWACSRSFTMALTSAMEKLPLQSVSYFIITSSCERGAIAAVGRAGLAAGRRDAAEQTARRSPDPAAALG